MPDLKEISEILIKRGKVRGKPVAVSFFHDEIAAGYEPVQTCPCSIVHYAMDEGTS